MKKSILFLCIVFITTNLYASPIVTTVGTSNGVVTISGSGFGPAPSVLFFDTLESGSDGEAINTGANSAIVGEWYELNTVEAIYSKGVAVSGDKAFKATSAIGVEGQTSASIILPSITTIFVSWWCYIPNDSPWSGEGEVGGINWKIVWMIQDSTTDNDLCVTQLSENTAIIGGNDTPLAYPDTEPNTINLGKGEWHHFWLFVNDGYDSDGEILLWEQTNNQKTVIKHINDATTARPNGVRKKIYINGYTKEQTVTQSTQLFDNIYISTGANARARVEIGNAQVYSEATKIIVSPASSWSTTSITATLNTGSFSCSDTDLYLFVIDADGTASAGKAITLFTGCSPISGNSHFTIGGNSTITFK